MERVYLTSEQAVSILPSGDDIHVFMNPNGMLLGADWSRDSVIKMLNRGKCELGGEMCMSMNHGLICVDNGKNHFVATRPQNEWSAELQTHNSAMPFTRSMPVGTAA